jgi:hypothetical protein
MGVLVPGDAGSYFLASRLSSTALAEVRCR